MDKKENKCYNVSVFDRLSKICNRYKLPIPPLEVRLEIGGIVKQEFFSSDWRGQYFFKRLQKEPEGEFNALFYPGRFAKVIDSVIYKQLSHEAVKSYSNETEIAS